MKKENFIQLTRKVGDTTYPMIVNTLNVSAIYNFQKGTKIVMNTSNEKDHLTYIVVENFEEVKVIIGIK